MTRIKQYRKWISNIRRREVSFALALGFMSAVIGTQPAPAQTYSVLYNFKGAPDGDGPSARLYRDGSGNLYGATTSGGAGKGVVFKLNTTNTERVLYKFKGGADGGSPQGGLIRDPAGTFYGATYSGGSGNGVVFKLSTGKEKVLHTFTGPDGAHPAAGLVRDKAGNLYGTTFYGGTASCSCGTVFKLDTAGIESVLYSFTGGADGKFPQGALILDSRGNLYGTASEGGIVNCDNGTDGCGVVFKVNTAGKQTVLYSFTGNADGGQPLAGLIRDSVGNLYGTTYSAGNMSRNCALHHGCGVVFKVSKTGQENVLYTFTNSTDGANPAADLVRDAATGNLYGTTTAGGMGYGVVFKVDSTGAETALYAFQGTPDGAAPLAGVIRDSTGNLYGTASSGGVNDGPGIVFKLTP